MITARAAATFEPVGRSVAIARAFVRDTLHGWGFADVVDDAVVLTSELVTNAVVHAGTAADVLCLRFDDGGTRRGRRPLPGTRDPAPDPRPPSATPTARAAAACCSAPPSPAAGASSTPATGKQVWFQLDLPERPVGTRSAGPVLPPRRLPLADGSVRVAVVQIDRAGAVRAWNEDAEELFGYAAEQVTGKALTDLAAWPHTPGTCTGIVEALQLSRWEGTYGIRGADGRVVPVYASHLRVRDTDGEPSTVCLLVRDDERAVLQTPRAGPSHRPGSPTRESRNVDPFEVFIGSPAPDDLDGLLQRTVERARDMLDGDSAFLLLATDDETELEVRASTGLPSARQRFARVPVEAGTGRYGSARMPAVHEDLDGRARRRTAARRHRHALGRHRPAQGRGPPHRLARRRRRITRPLLQRGGPAPPVRRRPHRAGRRIGPPGRAGTPAPRLAVLPRRSLRPARRHPGPRPDARPHGPDDGPDPGHLVRRLHDRRPEPRTRTSRTCCTRTRSASTASRPSSRKISPPDPVPTPGARVWTAPGDAAHPGRAARLHAQPRRRQPPPAARLPASPWPPRPRSAARPSSCHSSPATASSAC